MPQPTERVTVAAQRGVPAWLARLDSRGCYRPDPETGRYVKDKSLEMSSDYKDWKVPFLSQVVNLIKAMLCKDKPTS